MIWLVCVICVVWEKNELVDFGERKRERGVFAINTPSILRMKYGHYIIIYVNKFIFFNDRALNYANI